MKPEPTLPIYKKGRHGRWTCLPTPVLKGVTPGYFLPHHNQPRGWMFKCDGIVWMSLTKMEIESQRLMIEAARDHTVIAGLGMGFVLYNIAAKPEVTKVTLLEHDPEVVALMDQVTGWRHWPGHEKVTLIMGDAKEFRPAGPVDFLYADIWAHLGEREAVSITQAIQTNVKAARVAWWGQELDFIDYCRMRQIPVEFINLGLYREFAAWTGMPLTILATLFMPTALIVRADSPPRRVGKRLFEFYITRCE